MYDQFDIVAPDEIVDLEAEAPQWERARWDAMRAVHRERGGPLWVVGAEHGWIAATYARWANASDMVLIEPAPEVWPNIRLCWQHNGLVTPALCVAGFASDITAEAEYPMHGTGVINRGWPECARADEYHRRTYRYLFEPKHVGEIPSYRLDDLEQYVDEPPAIISIDVEGAEGRVLEGARVLLAAYRPIVFVSVHPEFIERWYPEWSTARMYDLMGGLGYHRDLIARDHEEHVVFTPKEQLG